MKKKFSSAWNSSKQPRKQRKFRANAPLHIKHRLLSAHLSKDLKQKYSKRSLPLKKGDKVKVLRGKFKGVIGEVEKVFLRKSKVHVKGAEVKKKDASKRSALLDPSNITILTLKLDDKRRIKALERKGNKQKKPVKTTGAKRSGKSASEEVKK